MLRYLIIQVMNEKKLEKLDQNEHKYLQFIRNKLNSRRQSMLIQEDNQQGFFKERQSRWRFDSIDNAQSMNITTYQFFNEVLQQDNPSGKQGFWEFLKKRKNSNLDFNENLLSQLEASNKRIQGNFHFVNEMEKQANFSEENEFDEFIDHPHLEFEPFLPFLEQEKTLQFSQKQHSKVKGKQKEKSRHEESLVNVVQNEETRLAAKVIKVDKYWKKSSYFIPNVFTMIQPAEEDEYLFEFQDYSMKEVLIQSDGQRL